MYAIYYTCLWKIEKNSDLRQIQNENNDTYRSNKGMDI